MSGHSRSDESHAKHELKPSSSESENQAFTQALRKVLSVSHAQVLARIPAKRKRTGTRPSDTPSSKARATGGASY
jgi:hypothetical protein